MKTENMDGTNGHKMRYKNRLLSKYLKIPHGFEIGSVYIYYLAFWSGYKGPLFADLKTDKS